MIRFSIGRHERPDSPERVCAGIDDRNGVMASTPLNFKALCGRQPSWHTAFYGSPEDVLVRLRRRGRPPCQACEAALVNMRSAVDRLSEIVEAR